MMAVNSDLNISAFVARQKANHFLIMQVEDQLIAGRTRVARQPDSKLALAAPPRPL